MSAPAGASGAEDAAKELRWQVFGCRSQARHAPWLSNFATNILVNCTEYERYTKQDDMQKLRGELEAESVRLPEEHRLRESHIDQFMSKAKRSKLTQTEAGLAEFRALCDRLDMTAKQVRFHMMGASLKSVLQ